MDRTQKEKLVAELHGIFSDAELVIVTRQSGMTVAETSTLRAEMREAGARFKVTKNRLAKIALEGTPHAGLVDRFEGPPPSPMPGPVSVPSDPRIRKKNQKLDVRSRSGARSSGVSSRRLRRAFARRTARQLLVSFSPPQAAGFATPPGCVGCCGAGARRYRRACRTRSQGVGAPAIPQRAFDFVRLPAGRSGIQPYLTGVKPNG